MSSQDKRSIDVFFFKIATVTALFFLMVIGLFRVDSYGEETGNSGDAQDVVAIKKTPVIEAVTGSNDYEIVVTYGDIIDAGIQDYILWGRSDLLSTQNGVNKVALYDSILVACENMDSIKASSFSYEGVLYYDMLTVSASGYNLSIDDALQVFNIFRCDHPEYYWISNTVFYNMNQLTSIINSIDLMTDADYDTPGERDIIDIIISNKLSEYTSVASGETSFYNKSKSIHDKIISEIDYAYDVYGNPSVELPAHNIVGVFDESGVVCEGYAKAYQYILNYLGIPNVYLVGTSGGGGHAWNSVMMDDGKYYLFDTTWDDHPWTESGVVYNYFAKGSDFFDVEHSVNTISGTGF